MANILFPFHSLSTRGQSTLASGVSPLRARDAWLSSCSASGAGKTQLQPPHRHGESFLFTAPAGINCCDPRTDSFEDKTAMKTSLREQPWVN